MQWDADAVIAWLHESNFGAFEKVFRGKYMFFSLPRYSNTNNHEIYFCFAPRKGQKQKHVESLFCMKRKIILLWLMIHQY